MGATFRRAERTLALSVRAWPFWRLPRPLAVFIIVVIAADVSLIAMSAAALSVHPHDLMIFGALLACNGATVELTRRASEPEGQVKDVHAVWELPVVVLLPPLYALLMPAIRLALTQWRVRRAPVYRRVFTAAAIGISYFCASVIFRGLVDLLLGGDQAPQHHVSAWILIVTACAAIQLIVNQALVLTAVKASEPGTRVRDLLGGESLHNDVTELSMAVLTTLAIAMSVLAVVIALPLVTVLQRSFRHVQLLRDSRADSKTGLLNAATWEREATAELARAVRTRTPLALALLDIDRFKSINDTYGHLTGDQVLKEIARALGSLLRDYDLAGRFGGEEFSVLLPQTRAVDAFRIAERVRAHIAGLSIITPGTDGGERVHVTVSIGMAALDNGSQREYAELMAAADAALYRAKAGGRNQVQMISTTRGLSAISGTESSTGSARGDVPVTVRRAQTPAPAGGTHRAPPLRSGITE